MLINGIGVESRGTTKHHEPENKYSYILFFILNKLLPLIEISMKKMWSCEQAPFVYIQGNKLAFTGRIPRSSEWQLYLFFIFHYYLKICCFHPVKQSVHGLHTSFSIKLQQFRYCTVQEKLSAPKICNCKASQERVKRRKASANNWNSFNLTWNSAVANRWML